MRDHPRRILGMALGLVLGLFYGLASQLVNVLALPGLPLYHPAPGLLGTVFLIALSGVLIGLITAWPEEPFPGVLLGAVSGALLSTLTSIATINEATPDAGRAVGFYAILFITFLPRALLFIPVAGLLHWVLGTWQNELRSAVFSGTKLTASVLLLAAVALGAGLLSLYSQEGRRSLEVTNQLIQAGQRASQVSSLPSPLQKVDGFLQGAQGPYTLTLSDNPDILPLQRPVASPSMTEYAVLVIFGNGYHFGCAFTPPHPDPVCGIY